MALSADATQLSSLLSVLTQPDTEAIRQAEVALKPLLKDPRCVPALVEVLKAKESQVSSSIRHWSLVPGHVFDELLVVALGVLSSPLFGYIRAGINRRFIPLTAFLFASFFGLGTSCSSRCRHPTSKASTRSLCKV